MDIALQIFIIVLLVSLTIITVAGAVAIVFMVIDLVSEIQDIIRKE